MTTTDRVATIHRRAARAALPLLRRLSADTESALRVLARRARFRSGPEPAGDRPTPPGPVAGAVGPGEVDRVDVGLAGRPRRSGRRGPAVILMYHRIADDTDPFRLAVRPDRFAAQLELLRLYADPVPLSEITRPARGPRVAVTFDDGYADNALMGLDALAAAGIPATVFVTSTMVDSPATMWPLHLERLFRVGRSRRDHLRIDAGEVNLVVPLSTGRDRETSMRTVHDRLRDLPPAELAAVMSVVEEHFEPLAADPGRRMLSRGELLDLAGSGLVTVGAHTRRHPQLSRLAATAQLEEIAGSRADLEGMIGRPVTQFAYPYGTRPSFDRESVRAVRRAGFSVACTTIPDPLVAGTSPLRLPRRMVLDWDGSEFGAHLERWLAA